MVFLVRSTSLLGGKLKRNKNSRLVHKEFKFSRQQLYYWRREGLISPKSKTSQKGDFKYSFRDRKVLKTIKYLKDSGMSTYRIKKCFKHLKDHFPNIKNPFASNPIFVFGNSIVFCHKGKSYDALSGQLFLLDFGKMKGWEGKILKFDQKKVSNYMKIDIFAESVEACNRTTLDKKIK